MARASEEVLLRGTFSLGRRHALIRLGVGAAALLLGSPRGAFAKAPTSELETLLEKSGFVYVSPLRSDGSESRCHGEVWFAWLDGSVVLITSKDAWKGRALLRGLDGARIWVGDHGRVGGLTGTEAFRQAPSFDAKAVRSEDAALLDRLMKGFREKYPDEIGRWEPRMRAGFASGERLLIRYTPR